MSLTKYIFRCNFFMTTDPNIGWSRSAFRNPPPIFILIPPFWDKWTLGSPSPYLSSNHRPRCCGTMSHSQLWRIHTSCEPSRHNSGRPHYGIGTNRFSSLTECGPNFFISHPHTPIHSKVVCCFNVWIFTQGSSTIIYVRSFWLKTFLSTGCCGCWSYGQRWRRQGGERRGQTRGVYLHNHVVFTLNLFR